MSSNASEGPNSSANRQLVAQVDEAMRQLRKRYTLIEVVEATQTLLVYCRNLIQHPRDRRYRKVKLSNIHYQERLGRLHGSRKLMSLIGYKLRNQYLRLQDVGEVSSEKERSQLLCVERALIRNLRELKDEFASLPKRLKPAHSFKGVKGAAAHSDIGARPSMEDDDIMADGFAGDPAYSYFGLYDGHGGRDAVNFITRTLHSGIEHFLKTHPKAHVFDAFMDGFLKTDGQLRRQNVVRCGSTAVACLIRRRHGAHAFRQQMGWLEHGKTVLGRDGVCRVDGIEWMQVGGGGAAKNEKKVPDLERGPSCEQEEKDSSSPGQGDGVSGGSSGAGHSDTEGKNATQAAGEDVDENEVVKQRWREVLQREYQQDKDNEHKVRTRDEGKHYGMMYLASVGDSRAVLSRGGKAVRLTRDHTPQDKRESARLLKAGAYIVNNRVNAVLAVSRAFGDHILKEKDALIAVPDLCGVPLRREDDFVIMACDGLWDVVSDQKAVDFVAARIKRYHALVCTQYKQQQARAAHRRSSSGSSSSSSEAESSSSDEEDGSGTAGGLARTRTHTQGSAGDQGSGSGLASLVASAEPCSDELRLRSPSSASVSRSITPGGYNSTKLKFVTETVPDAYGAKPKNMPLSHSMRYVAPVVKKSAVKRMNAWFTPPPNGNNNNNNSGSDRLKSPPPPPPRPPTLVPPGNTRTLEPTARQSSSQSAGSHPDLTPPTRARRRSGRRSRRQKDLLGAAAARYDAEASSGGSEGGHPSSKGSEGRSNRSIASAGKSRTGATGGYSDETDPPVHHRVTEGVNVLPGEYWNKILSQVCRDLVDLALNRQSGDNITVMIIKL